MHPPSPCGGLPPPALTCAHRCVRLPDHFPCVSLSPGGGGAGTGPQNREQRYKPQEPAPWGRGMGPAAPGAGGGADLHELEDVRHVALRQRQRLHRLLAPVQLLLQPKDVRPRVLVDACLDLVGNQRVLARHLRRGRRTALGEGGGGAVGRDALEGKGSQRRPQRRSDRRLEAVAKAVGGGYCRLQMPLKLALGVRETVAGHTLGHPGVRTPPSLFNASLAVGYRCVCATDTAMAQSRSAKQKSKRNALQGHVTGAVRCSRHANI